MRLPSTSDPLLFFPKLDRSDQLNGVFTLGWRFTDQRDESWTRRFTGFKYGNQKDIAGACAVMPSVVIREKAIPKTAALVTALPSASLELPQKHALRSLGESVVARTGWKWLPTALTKRKHGKLVDLKDSDSRDKEVADAYRCSHIEGMTTVVVLDDFVTRGSTINDVARAVRAACPAVKWVYGLALGKNESQIWAAGQGSDITNVHLAPELLQRWDAA